MKLIFSVFFFISCFIAAAVAQRGVSTEIPSESEASSTAFVHARCLQHFAHTYKNAGQVKWGTNKEGFGVRFTQNDGTYDVRYNQHGRWLSTIHYIPVEQLDKDVIQTVKNQYPDFKIFFAQKVTVRAGSVYLVKIEKGNEWKNLKVKDQEVIVSGEYIKG